MPGNNEFQAGVFVASLKQDVTGSSTQLVLQAKLCALRMQLLSLRTVVLQSQIVEWTSNKE